MACDAAATILLGPEAKTSFQYRDSATKPCMGTEVRKEVQGDLLSNNRCKVSDPLVPPWLALLA
jgi:hypothetical protein